MDIMASAIVYYRYFKEQIGALALQRGKGGITGSFLGIYAMLLEQTFR